MLKLHKLAELLLIKEHHSTVNEVDVVCQLAWHFIVHLHVLANQFVDLFVNTCKPQIEGSNEDFHSYGKGLKCISSANCIHTLSSSKCPQRCFLTVKGIWYIGTSFSVTFAERNNRHEQTLTERYKVLVKN
ncbi:hypothetical protein GQX74_004752 [Glossina fuscipes]|nr:hypothetical protein GQX74_004752 [Glossina fuscipes]